MSLGCSDPESTIYHRWVIHESPNVTILTSLDLNNGIMISSCVLLYRWLCKCYWYRRALTAPHMQDFDILSPFLSRHLIWRTVTDLLVLSPSHLRPAIWSSESGYVKKGPIQPWTCQWPFSLYSWGKMGLFFFFKILTMKLLSSFWQTHILNYPAQKAGMHASLWHI